MTEPIRITAAINGPVAFNRAEGLQLDGALLYHATKVRLGDAFFSARPANAELAESTRLPDRTLGLAVYESAGTWCYCISQAEIIGDYGTELHHWNKRFDAGLAGEMTGRGALTIRGKVNTGSGAFKSYHQPLFTEVIEDLVWYAIGDIERLGDLLPHVLGLGKHRNTGMGRVLRWKVDAAPSPRDRWLWQEPGRLARPVPLGMVKHWAGETAYCAYRPPAWLPIHQTLCAIPSLPMERGTHHA